MPNALKMIHATKFLGLDALLRAKAGDVPGAIDRTLMGLKFTPQTAQEGALMPYLVAEACTRILADFLGNICRDRKIGDDTLLRLIAELDASP